MLSLARRLALLSLARGFAPTLWKLFHDMADESGGGGFVDAHHHGQSKYILTFELNTELTFKHKAGDKLYDLSEEYESNGTMRFLGMAVILNFLLKTNRFVPIDEVETSIHYELLAYFIKVFLANSEGTSQMLLTTHDINLLNEDFIRRDTIWFTDKDELGETKIVRLSSLGLHKNLSPYNAYKQGKLVKLPFLGSQYINLND